jgi:hypothetical protein
MNADASVKSDGQDQRPVGDMPYPLDQWDWFGSALARYGGSSGDGSSTPSSAAATTTTRAATMARSTWCSSTTAPCRRPTSWPAARWASHRSRSTHGRQHGPGHGLGVELRRRPAIEPAEPSKTFAAPGTYDVRLTTRGPRGSDVEQKSAYITVGAGAAGGLRRHPAQRTVPAHVAFTDRSEGEVTSWSWDFGDGASSSSFAPVHEYEECGSYTVSLTVTGPSGTYTDTQPGFVVAALLPPAADFAASPETGPRAARRAVHRQDRRPGHELELGLRRRPGGQRPEPAAPLRPARPLRGLAHRHRPGRQRRRDQARPRGRGRASAARVLRRDADDRSRSADGRVLRPHHRRGQQLVLGLRRRRQLERAEPRARLHHGRALQRHAHGRGPGRQRGAHAHRL